MRAIGAAYLVVAVYVLVDAVNALRTANHPGASPIGMVLLAATVIVMAALGIAKLRVERPCDREPDRLADGRFSLIDGALAGAVLVGLVLSAVFGWWWA